MLSFSKPHKRKTGLKKSNKLGIIAFSEESDLSTTHVAHWEKNSRSQKYLDLRFLVLIEMKRIEISM